MWEKILDFFKKNNGKTSNSDLKNFDNSHLVDLDAKVGHYIEWYVNNRVKTNDKHVEALYATEMRDFIEKMAVWYEFRYPIYEVNKILHCTGQEDKDINSIMFTNNQTINNFLDRNNTIDSLKWSEFYNFDKFCESLPCEESYFLVKPRFENIIYLDHWDTSVHLHLFKNGIVDYSENVSHYTNSTITDSHLKGLHINVVAKLFKEKYSEFLQNKEIEKAIKNYNDWTTQYEEMLNCVMYRIISRGGNRIGPRRAFLFAKEFGRNIDIPMMYGIDHSDPGLRLFINEYIKAGGSKDLECFDTYFFNFYKDKEIKKISIQELILSESYNAVTFYTPEEDELHQRLVNAIASIYENNNLENQKVKKLTINKN